ncbi:MAG: multiheme c-type cytochrome [candidate division Zixibacteria bacterium]|nr:multiheme c-type cytochrome [candidate division Zixibacteria bacterium]
MRQLRIAAVGLAVLIAVFSGCERKVTEEVTKIVAAEDAAEYIGSSACGACHAATYESFQNTGHPYKLNEAEDVQAGDYYPFSDVPDAPSIVSWDDVDKVIGGFWWKARFIRHSGSIVTGAAVQYNLATEGWVGYHDGEDLPYDCGPCHMTAYRDTGNQEGHDSLIGTWAFGGVQCEECHGAGSLHASTPYDVAMKIDRSNEGCGKCHIRGDVNKIPASGSFVKHHEQWNEMFTTKHASIQCVDCHDVHYGLHPDSPDRDMAIKLTCENCHLEKTESFGRTDIEEHLSSPFAPGCIDCHMPKGAKSAVAADTYVGDVTSHLWRINTDVDAEYITDNFANGYLTVEYTCLQCHTTEDKAWAAANADRSHAPNTADTDVCMTCHDGSNNLAQKVIAATRQWEFSLHATGERSDRSRGSCAPCHTNEGFIADLEGEEVAGDVFNAIGCFTCHDPHTNGSFAIRTTDEVELGDGTEFDNGISNLCANCHKSRRDVATYVVAGKEMSNHFGPHHGPHADMVMGTNAYEYDGYTYTNSWHTSGIDDPCLSCHYDEADRYEFGGHSFRMRNEDGDENVEACNITGCHGDEFEIDSLNRVADADFDGDGNIEGVFDEIEGLIDDLQDELIAAGLLEWIAEDGIWEPTDDLVVPNVDSLGAVYNWAFVHEDQSHGIHNTLYAVGLLRSAYNYMTTGDPNGAPARRKPVMLTTH